MRVDTDHLGGIAEVAAALSVERNVVVNWRARHADFPMPVCVLASGPIYDVRKVLAWHRKRYG